VIDSGGGPESCKCKKKVSEARGASMFSRTDTPTAPRSKKTSQWTIRITFVVQGIRNGIQINEQGGVSHVETANVETRKANRKESGWVASRQDSQHCHARTDKEGEGCSRQPMFLWLCATGCVDNQCVDSQVEKVVSDIQ